MASKEQKLEVALAQLMQPVSTAERSQLPGFIENMPPEGVEWWIEWTRSAIERKRAQDILTGKLQQKKEL